MCTTLFCVATGAGQSYISLVYTMTEKWIIKTMTFLCLLSLHTVHTYTHTHTHTHTHTFSSFSLSFNSFMLFPHLIAVLISSVSLVCVVVEVICNYVMILQPKGFINSFWLFSIIKVYWYFINSLAAIPYSSHYSAPISAHCIHCHKTISTCFWISQRFILQLFGKQWNLYSHCTSIWPGVL